jgi:hypothetical protein
MVRPSKANCIHSELTQRTIHVMIKRCFCIFDDSILTSNTAVVGHYIE